MSWRTSPPTGQASSTLPSGPASVGGCASPRCRVRERLPPPAIRLVCRGSPRRGTPPPARGGGARSPAGQRYWCDRRIGGGPATGGCVDGHRPCAVGLLLRAGCERGLAEVDRVLRPGGLAVFVDNDVSAESTFSRWFAAAYPAYDPEGVERFWRRQGFETQRLVIEWTFERREDLAAVIGIEFPPSGCPLRRRVHRPRRPGRTHRRLRHRPPLAPPEPNFCATQEIASRTAITGRSPNVRVTQKLSFSGAGDGCRRACSGRTRRRARSWGCRRREGARDARSSPAGPQSGSPRPAPT